MANKTKALKKSSWQTLAGREQAMVLAAGLAVLLLLFWFLLLGPAIRTWHQVPVQRAQLEKDQAALQALSVQAQQLKNAQSLSFDAAYQALGSSTRQYLPAQTAIHLLGDQVTVKLQQVPAHSLAQWLAAARNNAKALPVSAQLSASAGDASGPLWSGTVVLRLPPRE